MPNVLAIITDLGGVLIAVDKTPMFGSLAKHSTLSKEEIAQHFSHTLLRAADLDFGRGIITPRQFYEGMCRKLAISGMSFDEFSTVYCDVFSRKDDVIQFLQRLGEKYAIALLSNTDALHYEEWSRLLGRDMKLFKEVILSFQVHAAKPGREIFMAAANKLKLRPEQCIYIDDIKEYSDAAAKVGMRGIHFVSLKQLKEGLAKLGVTA